MNKTFTIGYAEEIHPKEEAKVQKRYDEMYDGDLVYEDDADIIEQALGLDQILP